MAVDDLSSGAEPVHPEPQLPVDELWASFQQARSDLAEVMTDDELRDFGFNLEVLDQQP